MEYHRFNIGKPNSVERANDWWAENIARGVITAGFEGSPGDAGEQHLRAMQEGDWVLAYVSKKGFVGAGRVSSADTYKLHTRFPAGTLSDHLHERGVKWEFVIRDVEKAIPEGEAGTYHPVSTRQRVTEDSAAERLIAMLRQRGEHLLRHGQPASNVTSADLVALLESLDAPVIITKNKESEWAKNFRSDPLIEGRYLNGFWAVRPARVEKERGYVLHHVIHESVIWIGAYGGTVEEEGGRCSYVMEAGTPFRLTDFGRSSPAQLALWAILRQEGPVVSYYKPSVSDVDAPTFEFAQAKRRLQQANFRIAVFSHHGSRCAVTGCTTPELLEAAHLRGRKWEAGHNTGTDGIPLRVDLHRAYDCGLIELDGRHRLVAVSPHLHGEYDRYLDQ